MKNLKSIFVVLAMALLLSTTNSFAGDVGDVSGSGNNIGVGIDVNGTNTNNNNAEGGDATSNANATGGNANASVGNIGINAGSSVNIEAKRNHITAQPGPSGNFVPVVVVPEDGHRFLSSEVFTVKELRHMVDSSSYTNRRAFLSAFTSPIHRTLRVDKFKGTLDEESTVTVVNNVTGKTLATYNGEGAFGYPLDAIVGLVLLEAKKEINAQYVEVQWKLRVNARTSGLAIGGGAASSVVNGGQGDDKANSLSVASTLGTSLAYAECAYDVVVRVIEPTAAPTRPAKVEEKTSPPAAEKPVVAAPAPAPTPTQPVTQPAPVPGPVVKQADPRATNGTITIYNINTTQAPAASAVVPPADKTPQPAKAVECNADELREQIVKAEKAIEDCKFWSRDNLDRRAWAQYLYAQQFICTGKTDKSLLEKSLYHAEKAQQNYDEVHSPTDPRIVSKKNWDENHALEVLGVVYWNQAAGIREVNGREAEIAHAHQKGLEWMPDKIEEIKNPNVN